MTNDTSPQPCPLNILVAIMAEESLRLNIPPENLGVPDYVAYFPEYGTDSPGYHGPLVVIVWPAEPGAMSSFILRQGRWQHCNSSDW